MQELCLENCKIALMPIVYLFCRFLSKICVFGMLFALCISICIPNLLYAQGKNPFYVEILAPKLQVGIPSTIDVILVVPPEHHLYRDMMVVNITSSKQIFSEHLKQKSDHTDKLTQDKKTSDKNTSSTLPSSIVQIGEPVFEEGVFVQDPANPLDIRELYKNTTKIQLPITAKEEGTYQFQLYVRYQGCKKTLCYMPQYEDHVIDVAVSKQ